MQLIFIYDITLQRKKKEMQNALKLAIFLE